MPATSLDRAFCIDATEVTNSQYAVFLAAGGSSPQTPECSWKTSIVPPYAWPAPAENGEHPVAYVDWCDAFAYCKWAGKRLCGSVHGGGLEWQNLGGPSFDPKESEWYTVCSADGKFPDFYDTTEYDQTPCKAGVLGPEHTIPVASYGACHSPDPRYSSVYDMVGNVAEWEDSCDQSDVSSMHDLCLVRGGSYSHLGPWDCPTSDMGARMETKPTVGFRCCADPAP